jgi:hypothetical protein
VPGGDADAERDVGAEPSPAGRELVEPFLRLESQPDGFQLVLGERARDR